METATLAGYAEKIIVPAEKLGLSGFSARCNKPFEQVDDPIYVKALLLKKWHTNVAVIVYDLLAIGEELHRMLLTSLRQKYPEINFIFCSTHTHSAPATIKLHGCGEISAQYLELINSATVSAMDQADNHLTPVELRIAQADMSGLSYNRRRILRDGRVSMAMNPPEPFDCSNAVLPTMTILQLESVTDHKPLVGIAHWAAHPITQDTLNITADFPGLLCSHLTKKYQCPFIYLQGAAGDVNPIFKVLGREQLLKNHELLKQRLRNLQFSEAEKRTVLKYKILESSLNYQSLPAKIELEKFLTGMQTIADTGKGPAKQMKILADILNIEPGQELPEKLGRYIAENLADWCREILEQKRENIPKSLKFNIQVLEFGPFILLFIPAEVFMETTLKIRDSLPVKNILTVAYATPLVGYLPTAEAHSQGGYEVDYAYRFYNHPAPFEPDAEIKLINMIKEGVLK